MFKISNAFGEVENPEFSGNSETSELLFSSFSSPSFRIYHIPRSDNLEIQTSGKLVDQFRDFSSPSFRICPILNPKTRSWKILLFVMQIF